MTKEMQFCDSKGKSVECDYVILDKTRVTFETYKVLCEYAKKEGFENLSQFIEFRINLHKNKYKSKVYKNISKKKAESLGIRGAKICYQDELNQVLSKKNKNEITFGKIEY